MSDRNINVQGLEKKKRCRYNENGNAVGKELQAKQGNSIKN